MHPIEVLSLSAHRDHLLRLAGRFEQTAADIEEGRPGSLRQHENEDMGEGRSDGLRDAASLLRQAAEEPNPEETN